MALVTAPDRTAGQAERVFSRDDAPNGPQAGKEDVEMLTLEAIAAVATIYLFFMYATIRATSAATRGG
jgi:hypothetical protein